MEAPKWLKKIFGLSIEKTLTPHHQHENLVLLRRFIERIPPNCGGVITVDLNPEDTAVTKLGFSRMSGKGWLARTFVHVFVNGLELDFINVDMGVFGTNKYDQELISAIKSIPSDVLAEALNAKLSELGARPIYLAALEA